MRIFEAGLSTSAGNTLVVHSYKTTDTQFAESSSYRLREPTNTNRQLSVCSYTSRSSTTPQQHVTSPTGEGKKEKFKRVCVTKSADGKFRCDKCAFVTAIRNSMRRHILRHSTERPHQCHLCPKGFIEKTDLNTHLMKHAGEKPFKCNLCEKGYYNRASLKKHLVLHIVM
ncbi:hypothetical protein TNCV_3573671 [Trichonephila clavipes]|nr:hypothetical protein TNCV_3573671 [Trichonephila clavipes]